MKRYTKVHKTKKIADIHLAKIEKRGGIATTEEVAGGIQIDYHFPDKSIKTSATAPTKKVVYYDILSPDGISIRMGDQDLFKSHKEARTYFNKWKKRFQQQGYYSSNHGRIALDDLHYECDVIDIEQ